MPMNNGVLPRAVALVIILVNTRAQPSCDFSFPCVSLGDQTAINYNASLSSLLANTVGCTEPTPSGRACEVSCASGFVGGTASFSCPCPNFYSPSRGAGQAPEGLVPTCAPVVGCSALPDQGDAYVESACVAVAAGASCEVTCAENYAGTPATFSCPSDNTDAGAVPQAEAVGVALGTGCLPLTGCAAWDAGTGIDGTACASVSAGGTCSLSCSPGYTTQPGEAASVELSCPSENTDATTSLSYVLNAGPLCHPIVGCAALSMTERHAADPSCNSLVRLCSDNPNPTLALWPVYV